MDIYLLEEDQQTGPFDVARVNERLATGEITAETLAWFEGAPGWVMIVAVPGVELQSPPTVPPSSYQSPHTKSGWLSKPFFKVAMFSLVSVVAIVGAVLLFSHLRESVSARKSASNSTAKSAPFLVDFGPVNLRNLAVSPPAGSNALSALHALPKPTDWPLGSATWAFEIPSWTRAPTGVTRDTDELPSMPPRVAADSNVVCIVNPQPMYHMPMLNQESNRALLSVLNRKTGEPLWSHSIEEHLKPVVVRGAVWLMKKDDAGQSILTGLRGDTGAKFSGITIATGGSPDDYDKLVFPPVFDSSGWKYVALNIPNPKLKLAQEFPADFSGLWDTRKDEAWNCFASGMLVALDQEGRVVWRYQHRDTKLVASEIGLLVNYLRGAVDEAAIRAGIIKFVSSHTNAGENNLKFLNLSYHASYLEGTRNLTVNTRQIPNGRLQVIGVTVSVLPERFFSAPVMVSNMVFIATADKVLAIDRLEGRLLWQTDIPAFRVKIQNDPMDSAPTKRPAGFLMRDDLADSRKLVLDPYPPRLVLTEHLGLVTSEGMMLMETRLGSIVGTTVLLSNPSLSDKLTAISARRKIMPLSFKPESFRLHNNTAWIEAETNTARVNLSRSLRYCSQWGEPGEPLIMTGGFYSIDLNATPPWMPTLATKPRNMAALEDQEGALLLGNTFLFPEVKEFSHNLYTIHGYYAQNSRRHLFSVAHGGTNADLAGPILGPVDRVSGNPSLMPPGEPLIVSHVTNATASRGEEVTLKVTVEGTPPFDFIWYHRQGLLKNQPQTNSLTFKMMGATNAGEYWVAVRNSRGFAASRGFVFSDATELVPTRPPLAARPGMKMPLVPARPPPPIQPPQAVVVKSIRLIKPLALHGGLFLQSVGKGPSVAEDDTTVAEYQFPGLAQTNNAWVDVASDFVLSFVAEQVLQSGTSLETNRPVAARWLKDGRQIAVVGALHVTNTTRTDGGLYTAYIGDRKIGELKVTVSGKCFLPFGGDSTTENIRYLLAGEPTELNRAATLPLLAFSLHQVHEITDGQAQRIWQTPHAITAQPQWIGTDGILIPVEKFSAPGFATYGLIRLERATRKVSWEQWFPTEGNPQPLVWVPKSQQLQAYNGGILTRFNNPNEMSKAYSKTWFLWNEAAFFNSCNWGTLLNPYYRNNAELHELAGEFVWNNQHALHLANIELAPLTGGIGVRVRDRAFKLSPDGHAVPWSMGWPVLDQKPIVIPTLKEGLLFPEEFPPWNHGVMSSSELSPHWRDNEARVSAFRRFTASSEGTVTFITRSIYVPLSLRHTGQQWNWNRSSGANFRDWGYGRHVQWTRDAIGKEIYVVNQYGIVCYDAMDAKNAAEFLTTF